MGDPGDAGYSTAMSFFDFFIGTMLLSADLARYAYALPARTRQKGGPEGAESHRVIYFYILSQRALGAGPAKPPPDAISPFGLVSTPRHEGSNGVRTP